MKIMMLGCREYPPKSKSGGIEKCVEKIVGHLPSCYRADVVAGRLSIFEALRHIKEERIQVLHGHGFFGGLLGMMSSRFTNTPFIFTPHGMCVRRHPVIAKPVNWIMKQVCKRADRVVYVSQLTKDRLGIDGDVIPNGYEKIEEAAKPKPDGSICFLFLGRLVKFKGVLDVIASFIRLSREYDDIHLLIAGDGPLREKVQTLALHYCYYNKPRINIRFLGWLEQDEVSHTYACSDVFVLPSTEVGCPIALMEAMAFGKIVITSLPYIEDGVTGIRCGTDSMDVYEKMKHVCENFRSCQKLGRNARQAMRGMTWDNIIKRYERVYEEAVRG